jgi:hypothetical protein
MANTPVAFFVLATFFVVYFVAALWRSRSVRHHGQRRTRNERKK